MEDFRAKLKEYSKQCKGPLTTAAHKRGTSQKHNPICAAWNVENGDSYDVELNGSRIGNHLWAFECYLPCALA